MVWYPGGKSGTQGKNAKVYPTNKNPSAQPSAAPSGTATPYKYLFGSNPSRTPSRAGPSGSRTNYVPPNPQPQPRIPPPKPAEKPKPPPKPAAKPNKEKLQPPPKPVAKPKTEKSPTPPKPAAEPNNEHYHHYPKMPTGVIPATEKYKGKKEKPPPPSKPEAKSVKEKSPAPSKPAAEPKNEHYHHYPKMPTGVIPATEKFKGSQPKSKSKKPKPTKSELIWKSLGELKTMPPAPQSLKFLENLDSFFVQDSCQPIELWNGFETGTQYIVLNKNKQILLTATEKTKCFKLCMCRTDRTFMYRLLDKDGKEILKISRPCSCKCCFGAKLLGDLCGHKILVTLADGSKAGEVVQKCCKINGGCCSCRCCCTPMYVVNDCVGNPTLKIAGPSCGFMCCCRMSPCCSGKYKVLSLIKEPMMPIQIGEIANNWVSNGNQFVQGGYLTAEDSSLTIGSTFPPNLDVRTKATVIGAVFLLDFLHFEKEPCCGLCQFCC